MAHIPLFYRLFFLYIDPLICLSGIYLAFLDPQSFLLNAVPSALTSSIDPTTAPLAAYLIISIGAYSLAILSLQLLLLHGLKDAPNGLNVKLWKILQFSILLIDIGLIYGIYVSSPAELATWAGKDWGNVGILGALIIIRSAFLVGIGGVGRSV
jgi:hypothetical protein